MSEAEAKVLVSALEAFIDANIASAIRQQMPEYAYKRHDINELYDARNHLTSVLVKHLSK